MSNIGLDCFPEGRITGTLEVYDKETKGSIWYYPVKVPPYLVLTLGKCRRNKQQRDRIPD